MTSTSTPDASTHAGHHRVPLVASLLAVGAGVVWAMGSVTIQLADDADAWQYLVWRSIGVLIVMEVISRAKGAGWMTPRAYNQGAVMLLGCVGLFLASIAFVYAMKTTTEANAAFLASVTPIFAVVIARFVLHERLSAVTLGAIGLAFVGLLVIVVGDISGGAMSGNIAALCSSLGFAVYTVCVRSSATTDWSPILPGYALMMIVICGAVTVANDRPLVPGWPDTLYPLLHGAVFIVVGTIMFNAGSRSVPAVPMTIFAQSETVFVPLFIFIWFGRSPKALTLLGGAIILAAVIGKAVLDSRPRRIAPIDDDEPFAEPAAQAGPGSIA